MDWTKHKDVIRDEVWDALGAEFMRAEKPKGTREHYGDHGSYWAADDKSEVVHVDIYIRFGGYTGPIGVNVSIDGCRTDYLGKRARGRGLRTNKDGVLNVAAVIRAVRSIMDENSAYNDADAARDQSDADAMAAYDAAKAATGLDHSRVSHKSVKGGIHALELEVPSEDLETVLAALKGTGLYDKEVGDDGQLQS